MDSVYSNSWKRHPGFNNPQPDVELGFYFIFFFFKRSIVVKWLFQLFASWIAGRHLWRVQRLWFAVFQEQDCRYISRPRVFSNSSWITQITRWELRGKERRGLQHPRNLHFKSRFKSTPQAVLLLIIQEWWHPCRKTSHLAPPVFHGFTKNIPSVVRLKHSSCVFSFSDFGLDASVGGCQVALFPSRWLCDSPKMRKEDNKLSLSTMTKWVY